MKLIANIGGEDIPLDVRREGTRVLAEVGGRGYELVAREVEPGVFLIVNDGNVSEVYFGDGARGERPPSGASEITARYGRGHGAYAVSLIDPRRLRGAGTAAGHDGGRALIVAPMPGKVVRVLVEHGQAVEAGQGVVVVEAMKMQNEMKSPKAGAVIELHAQSGATVNAGDVLAVIE